MALEQGPCLNLLGDKTASGAPDSILQFLQSESLFERNSFVFPDSADYGPESEVHPSFAPAGESKTTTFAQAPGPDDGCRV